MSIHFSNCWYNSFKCSNSEKKYCFEVFTINYSSILRYSIYSY